MSLSNIETYLYYLKTSFGPSSLVRIQPKLETNSSPPLFSLQSIQALYESLSYSPPYPHFSKSKFTVVIPAIPSSTELFEKILQATKIPEINILTYEKNISPDLWDEVLTKEIELCAPQVIVKFGSMKFFTQNNSGDFEDFLTSNSFHQSRLISTHSIDELNSKQELKKDTWNVLQKVMKCLND